MAKKKSSLRVLENDDFKPRGRIVNTPSRDHQSQLNLSSGVIKATIAETVSKQVFSSEDQAIEVLLSQVVSRLSDNPEEQADMADFLEMVLETDPVLRDEILAGTTIRK